MSTQLHIAITQARSADFLRAAAASRRAPSRRWTLPRARQAAVSGRAPRVAGVTSRSTGPA